jgi:hypothetical protein
MRWEMSASSRLTKVAVAVAAFVIAGFALAWGLATRGSSHSPPAVHVTK